MKKSENREFRTARGYQILNQREGMLTSSMEDYLEMIYRACSSGGYSRVGKVSELLHVKPSSASKMIFKLADMGYIRYDRYEIIQLTETGEKTGAALLNRHMIIEEFLQLIGSPNALEETELIEHSLSSSTVENLRSLINYFKSDPQAADQFEKIKKKTVAL